MTQQATKVKIRQRRLTLSEVVKLRSEFATNFPDGWTLRCHFCTTWARAKAMEYGVSLEQIVNCVREASWVDKK